jgi:nitrite reductase (NO-forming)
VPAAPDASVPAPGATAPPPFRGALPILGQSARPGVGIARSTDRRIAFGGLAVAALYLALAAASLLLPPAIRLGTWLPAHLALAGAGATAIAAILPFFSAALAVAQPVRPAIRIGGIALVAIGAVAAMTAYGHAAGEALPAALAGGSFIAGIGLVAVAAFAPLRRSLGPRRVLVERAYALALANVAIGATFATFLVGGNDAVAAAWGFLKPAHAWLNLIGFVGLVIVASLLHLAPTVAGTRMRPRRSGQLAVIGVAIGAPLVAAGYALRLDLLAQAGAAAVLAGGHGVILHAIGVARDGAPGRWTTDPGWHRLTAGALLAGQLWLATGLLMAAARVLGGGAAPTGWSLAPLIGPLVIGGIAQVLVGAMTHLLPAIGPGDPVRHAAQRRLLGRAATIRLVALNAGAAFVTLGSWPTAAAVVGTMGSALVGVGLAVAAVGLGASLALLAFGAALRPARGSAAWREPGMPREAGLEA